MNERKPSENKPEVTIICNYGILLKVKKIFKLLKENLEAAISICHNMCGGKHQACGRCYDQTNVTYFLTFKSI